MFFLTKCELNTHSYEHISSQFEWADLAEKSKRETLTRFYSLPLIFMLSLSGIGCSNFYQANLSSVSLVALAASSKKVMCEWVSLCKRKCVCVELIVQEWSFEAFYYVVHGPLLGWIEGCHDLGFRQFCWHRHEKKYKSKCTYYEYNIL